MAQKDVDSRIFDRLHIILVIVVTRTLVSSRSRGIPQGGTKG